MQAMNNTADTVLGYTLALYAMLSLHSGEIMGFLGFVLLLAKLVQELPKAFKVLRGKDE